MREQYRKGEGEATDRGERGPHVGVPLYADAGNRGDPGRTFRGSVCGAGGSAPPGRESLTFPRPRGSVPDGTGAAEDGGREGGMRPKNSLLCWMLTNKGDRKAHVCRDLGSSACLSAPEDNSKAAPLARHTGPRSRGPLSSPGPQPPSGHREPRFQLERSRLLAASSASLPHQGTTGGRLPGQSPPGLKAFGCFHRVALGYFHSSQLKEFGPREGTTPGLEPQPQSPFPGRAGGGGIRARDPPGEAAKAGSWTRSAGP